MGIKGGFNIAGSGATSGSNSFSSFSSNSGNLIVNSDNEDCGSITINSSGNGPITYADSNYITVGGKTIYFGPCTSKSYRRGRTSFSPSDIVSYDTYQSGGKTYARKVSCNE